MPKERESFTLTIKYNGLVFDTETGIQVAEAREVPSHGRLIDVDAAYEQFLNLMDTQGAINPCQLGTILVDAPVVIEEEVYGQYTDTAGNFHWYGTHSGEHIIKAENK